MKRVVLTAFGSLGDLHPYLAIAHGLKQRGHHPVLATSAAYYRNVLNAGIEFARLSPDLLDFNFERDGKNVNDPKRGTEFIIKNILLPHIRDSINDLTRALAGADLLIAHPITFAAPLVAEKLKLPWLSTVLNPLNFLSHYDPPPVSIGKFRFLGPLLIPFVALLRRHVNLWLHPLHQLRQELGLPFRKDLLKAQFSPYGTLALFSKVLAKQKPDWPDKTCITGFPIFEDTAPNYFTLSRLESFLKEGNPPVVFTLGSSAVMDAKDFYVQSIEAAKKIGQRAVLLTGRIVKNVLPEPLPSGMISLDYIPFPYIFPRAAAIVLHGGIGTLAEGLRSGHPMLIVPIAHDQPDNAQRAKRLNVARCIQRTDYSADRVAKELHKLITNKRYEFCSSQIRNVIDQESAINRACDVIEETLNNSSRPSTSNSENAEAIITKNEKML
jgi:rhamnosyltransferase subunit B